MPTKIKKGQPALIVTNIANFLKQKNNQLKATFVYSAAGSHFLLEGKVITEKQLSETYPANLVKLSRENIDSTSNWI